MADCKMWCVWGNCTERTTILRHFRKQGDELPPFLGNHSKNGDLQAGRQVAGHVNKPFALVGFSVFQLCHCHVPTVLLSDACVNESMSYYQRRPTLTISSQPANCTLQSDADC